jgi:hypothetical protein
MENDVSEVGHRSEAIWYVMLRRDPSVVEATSGKAREVAHPADFRRMFLCWKAYEDCY